MADEAAAPNAAPERNTDALLEEARKAFDRAQEAEADNREAALEDIRFARLDEQWPEEIAKQRRLEGRPCLTINRLPTFIRQVVNDARQNKPSIKVHPVDSVADPKTADIQNGVIRHIEYASNADVAYDTAIESAVSGGVGYWRVGTDYAHDDTFDLDLRIERISDPFTVYGDPDSTAADSSDWNVAFVVERMRKEVFERSYPNAECTDWDMDFRGMGSPWLDGEFVLVAEWWTREQVDRTLVRLTNGSVIDASLLERPDVVAGLMAENVGPDPNTPPRVTKSYRVTQRIMTGAEILEEREWPGRFIPIVPVYGDEVNIEGKRHFRSLIRPAKDAQRNFNFWRTAATELVALAPRVPFIGPKGSFATDAEKWATINRESHAYVEYDDKGTPPQRQPLGGETPAAAITMALQSSDDIKSILGLYDASLGARSNETSGKAILARQREGDVATFHFLDNLNRAIRHTGRILLDLIPHIYTGPRIIRIVGEDGNQSAVPVNQPVPVMGQDGQPQTQPDPITGQPVPVTRIYDLTAGKYDLTVKTGPSYTTQREEAAAQITELIRAFPAAAPVLGDLLAKMQDWPEAEEVRRRLAALLPPQLKGDQIPPELKAKIEEGQKLIEEGAKRIQELEAKLQAAEASQQIDAAKLQLEAQKLEIERSKAQVAMFEAKTDRMRAEADLLAARQPPAPVQMPPRAA